MALGCGVKCAKGVLITFNLIFWLSGCALIAVGIFFLIEEGRSQILRLFAREEEFHYSRQQLLALAVVGVGALVFVVGFFGCCGAMHENKCMLVTYFIFLFLILAAELSIGVLAMIFQEKEFPEMEGRVKEHIKSKYGTDESMTHAIDFVQTKLSCCGLSGGSDFWDSAWRGRGDEQGAVPLSCCTLKNADDPDAHLRPQPNNDTLCRKSDSQPDPKYRHQKGCKEKLQEYLREGSMCFVLLGCVAAALEIFGMIFSICLCREI